MNIVICINKLIKKNYKKCGNCLNVESICFRCHRLSVCCDNKIVSVFGISEDLKLSLIYENRNLHSNFVRGMVWDNDDRNVLHTVGWDGNLKTHKLPH